MIGLSTRGSISLGCAFVAGRKRVPSPAAGKTALVIFVMCNLFLRFTSGNRLSAKTIETMVSPKVNGRMKIKCSNSYRWKVERGDGKWQMEIGNWKIAQSLHLHLGISNQDLPIIIFHFCPL
jgi:hypothetical protein